MKLNTRYLKAALAGSMVSILSIGIIAAGLAYLIIIGQIGEGSAELWINAAIAIGVIIGGLLSSSFFDASVICNTMIAGILIIMMLVCGLIIGGKTVTMIPRIGAIIAGFISVCIISRNRGRKKKRKNRQYR